MKYATAISPVIMLTRKIQNVRVKMARKDLPLDVMSVFEELVSITSESMNQLADLRSSLHLISTIESEFIDIVRNKTGMPYSEAEKLLHKVKPELAPMYCDIIKLCVNIAKKAINKNVVSI